MSNHLRYLLTKELDTADPDKPEKRFKPRFFHPILEVGEDQRKKKDMDKYHIA